MDTQTHQSASPQNNKSSSWTRRHHIITFLFGALLFSILIPCCSSNTKKCKNGDIKSCENACNYGNTEACTKACLGGSVGACNAKDNDGNTPLMLAIQKGDDETVKMLLEKGANVRVKNNVGETPLHMAAKSKTNTVAKLLIESLPTPVAPDYYDRSQFINEKDNNGYTALCTAIDAKNIELIEMLCQQGAIFYTQTNKGNTPLHIAAARNNTEVLKVLLKYIPESENPSLESTDLNIQNNDGDTPYHLAAKYGRCENGLAIQNWLEENYGWDLVKELVIIQNKEGNTAQHLWLLSQNPQNDLEAIRSCTSFDINRIAHKIKNNNGSSASDLWSQRYEDYTKIEKCHVSKWQTIEDMENDNFYIKNIAGFDLVILPWIECSSFRHDIESIQSSVELDGTFPHYMQRPLSESLLDCYRASAYPKMGRTGLKDLAKDCNGRWF